MARRSKRSKVFKSASKAHRKNPSNLFLFHRSSDIAKRHAQARIAVPTLPVRKIVRKMIVPEFMRGTQNIKPVSLIKTPDLIKPAICKARKVRRAVLFAKGKSGGNHKPPRFSIFSQVRC